MNKVILPFLLVLVAGCADMAALKEARGTYADPATEMTTVLQFIPGTEGEYGRQEAPYVNAGAYYRLQKLINIEGEVRSVEGALLSGKVRFAGALPGGAPDPATIRQKEFDVIDGSFIARIVPGDYLVDIIPSRADLYPTQRIPVVVKSDTRTLELTAVPGGIVTGTVRDANGAGISGVSVRVLSAGGSVGSQSVITSSGDSTAGAYKIAVGPDLSKAHRIEFSAQDKFFPRVVFAVSVTANSLQTGGGGSAPSVALDITYAQKTDKLVTGKVVVDETGEPAADVGVVFSASTPQAIVAARRHDSTEANQTAEAIFTTKTDAAGLFSLTIPEGAWTYALNLQPPLDRPYGGLNQSTFVFTEGVPVYRLKGKKAVTGRVFDAASKPVFAEVIITKTLSLVDSQQVLRVYTDATGEFSAKIDAAVGAYDVTVLPLDGIHAQCRRSTVTPSGFDESFFVHPGEKSTGYVADRDGNPLARVAVTLVGRPASAGTASRVLAESEALTDSQGLFSLLVPKDLTLTGCRGAQIRE